MQSNCPFGKMTQLPLRATALLERNIPCRAPALFGKSRDFLSELLPSQKVNFPCRAPDLFGKWRNFLSELLPSQKVNTSEQSAYHLSLGGVDPSAAYQMLRERNRRDREMRERATCILVHTCYRWIKADKGREEPTWDLSPSVVAWALTRWPTRQLPQWLCWRWRIRRRTDAPSSDK